MLLQPLCLPVTTPSPRQVTVSPPRTQSRRRTQSRIPGDETSRWVTMSRPRIRSAGRTQLQATRSKPIHYAQRAGMTGRRAPEPRQGMVAEAGIRGIRRSASATGAEGACSTSIRSSRRTSEEGRPRGRSPNLDENSTAEISGSGKTLGVDPKADTCGFQAQPKADCSGPWMKGPCPIRATIRGTCRSPRIHSLGS